MSITMFTTIQVAALVARPMAPTGPSGADVRQARDTSTSEVRGTVTDSLRAPLAEVEVALEGLSVKLTKSAKTDARGEFQIPKLIGNEFYRITFRKAGFRELTQDVTAPKGKSKVLTIVLARANQPSSADSGKTNEAIISGRVIPFEAPVFYSALVTLLDSTEKILSSVVTWDDGKYEIRHVPAGGPYSLMVTSMGFKEAFIDSVRVKANEQLTFNPLLAWTGNLEPSGRLRGYRVWAWYWPREILRRYPRETAADIYTQLTFRFHSRWEARCPVAEKFFVNGQRLAEVPGAVLGQIAFKDVEEVRYIECYDEAFPHLQRNSYWFRVKPSGLPKIKKGGAVRSGPRSLSDRFRKQDRRANHLDPGRGIRQTGPSLGPDPERHA